MDASGIGYRDGMAFIPSPTDDWFPGGRESGVMSESRPRHVVVTGASAGDGQAAGGRHP
jgi:hypothetical protein